MKIDFFFDFETRSHADLTEVDSINYALHPSTEATLLTWCFGRTGTVKAWRKGQHIHEDLIEVAMNPHKYNFIAHNIGFDYLIWTIPFKNKVIGCIENPKLENIEDNMALTCHYRVGASLGRAADILGMPYNKDKEGRKLMLKQCKPNPRTGQFIELDEAEWEQFEIYGRTDTRLLRDIYYLCPALPAPERFAWEWTFRRNLRGIRVDTALIDEMDRIIKEEMPSLTAKFDRLVGGKVKLNSPTKTKEWFSQYYPWIENMQADTIREMMLDDRPEIPAFAKEALEIKDLAGSTSLAKVDTAKSIMYNGRIYNLLAYHYAQTKRWAGRGVQIQNFPRVDRKKPDKIDFDLNADDITTPLRIKRPSLQDPLGFIKNLLRRIWIPDHGLEFYCGDWSRIEPTVLFWLVGLGPIPDGWYEDMAATIYGIDVSTVKKDSDERQLGKSAALGCGYGMGHAKFRVDVFKKIGLRITENLAKQAVYAYRNKYPQITDLWTNLEYAMKAAAQYGTTTQLCNGKLHVMRMACPKPGAVGVKIRLPSGGELFYHDVKVDHEGLTYLADDGGAVFRKKLYGGLLTEHVTSATARDILVPAIYRLEQAGFDILTLIHDEMWAQAIKGREAEFERLMCINPSWCTDMRISASVDTGRRYLK